MLPDIRRCLHFVLLFIEWKIFQTKLVQKIKTRILCLVTFYNLGVISMEFYRSMSEHSKAPCSGCPSCLCRPRASLCCSACTICLYFKLPNVSQLLVAAHLHVPLWRPACFDVEYISGFVWWGGLRAKSMASQRNRQIQDGGYSLLC